MRELALHLLDIAENSVAADARNINISVHEDTHHDTLHMQVADDGKGMDADLVQKVIDPFVTSRTTRKVGLGIPLLKAAAEACNGSLEIQSAPGAGTTITVSFQRSHIDRMPLGDLAATFLHLIIAYPHIHWMFTYEADDRQFFFDDRDLKAELESIPLSEPTVLKFLRELITDGIESTHY